ncbi:DNA excision repair protein ERCC-1 isoform 1 [Hibiscus syriacus]|uniref:DNA excision repair protein ERCC-1 isoform 1 n=1 Tax=Hibiscus syriacus TaxID=106335 RepID=A0A6A3CH49_HIBSY|nr:DNA excision repair protein ERCC-1 isoform 1 [Hibiscus syriacus]
MEHSKTTVTEPSPGMSTTGLSTAKNHSHHLKHHHRHFNLISRNHQHNTGLSFNSIVIIILSLVSVLVASAIFLIIVMFRRLKSVGKGDTCNESGSINNSTSSMFTAHTTMNFDSSPGMRPFSKSETSATDNFSEMNEIGNREFGVMYRGVLADITMAAIKRLHRDGKQGERALRMEVDLLSRLNYLHFPGNQHQSSDLGNRLVIALDCARTLEFLHEHASPTVIHRELKCSNILLDKNLRAKVSGFGLAKTGSDKMDGQISTRVLGTTRYLAPEYVSKGKLTTRSDVYSYGVALPRLTNRDKVDEMVDPAIQGQYSKKDLIQVVAIAAMCVQPEADYRPLMVDVVQSLIPLVKNFNSTAASRFL